jgi:glycosyltransferase involved in cell wall biosynthesis
LKYKEPLVSVVTPVYNTEKYLSECIESVLCQTYQNWEYIIVNNCSTDRTLEIATDYAGKDKRIRVHNNSEFLGILQNSNHAVRQMSPHSEYCKILHADDWLFPDCLRSMVDVAEENPSVGMVASYRLDENEVNLDGLPYPSTVTSGREICRMNLMKGTYLFGSPTSLLIRSGFVRQRKNFYNESNIHADKEICFEILKASDFGFVHQVLTFTRRHNESNTARVKRYNSVKIATLLILKQYGPLFLSEDEYQQRMKILMNRYYLFLTELLLNRGGRKQYELHRTELAKMGITLDKFKLIKTIGMELFNLTDSYYRLKQRLKEKNNTKLPPAP